MPPDEPSWWYDRPNDWRRTALQPIATIYAAAATRRLRQRPRFTAPIPVVCVGNFVAGGSGKTPIVRAIAARLSKLGRRPAILSRGYGGRLPGPAWVDPLQHGARDVGDEPWMLAGDWPVLISRRRETGAREIVTSRPDIDVIVMDDGLQNPSLLKSLALAVVDVDRGLGNGAVIPAGPLRAPIAAQLTGIDALVLSSQSSSLSVGSDRLSSLRRSFSGPTLRAATALLTDVTHLKDTPVVVFAAIANPGRVFRTARAAGLHVVDEVAFADHHLFTDAELIDLERRAVAYGAVLVTTEKDFSRLATGSAIAKRVGETVEILRVGADFDDQSSAELDRLIAGILS